MSTEHDEPTEPTREVMPLYVYGDHVRITDWDDLEHLLKGEPGGIINPRDDDGTVICFYILVPSQGVYVFYPISAMEPDLFRCHVFVPFPVLATFSNMILLANLQGIFGDQT